VFYLRSRHGDTGTNVMFHNKNGAGYGTNLDNLHVFTTEEAQKKLDWDIKSLPLLKSEVDKLSILAVDMQYLDAVKSKEFSGLYVVQMDRKWNGNDICFYSEDGETFDYGKAHVFIGGAGVNFILGKSGMILWPKDYLDTICRRTFQSTNINTRKMITGAGIVYRKPRKPRPTTGKTRGNCPECGKITWDYNPYEDAYCADHYCK